MIRYLLWIGHEWSAESKTLTVYGSIMILEKNFGQLQITIWLPVKSPLEYMLDAPDIFH